MDVVDYHKVDCEMLGAKALNQFLMFKYEPMPTTDTDAADKVIDLVCDLMYYVDSIKELNCPAKDVIEDAITRYAYEVEPDNHDAIAAEYEGYRAIMV